MGEWEEYLSYLDARADALFTSGGIPPDQRERLKVWNNAFMKNLQGNPLL